MYQAHGRCSVSAACLGSLLFALAVASPAAASAPDGVAEFAERARTAEEGLEYEEASSLWLRILLLDGITEAQRVEAYLNAGRIALLLGREDEASSHFLFVLRREPNHQLPPATAPRVRDHFEALRQQVGAEMAPKEVQPPADEEWRQSALDPAPTPATSTGSDADTGEAEEIPLLLAGGGATAGFGAVVLVFGGVMGVMSLQAHEAAQAGTVQVEREASYNERDSLALVANVGYVGGAVLLTAGAGLAGASLLVEEE